MLKNTGIISDQELEIALPSAERFQKGPVAILECIQDIPCDPCVSSCPFQAITMAEGITSRPALDFAKCTGCGVCIPKCPGLAIFVVNKGFTDKTATISLSYELFPLPEKDGEVMALDRAGQEVQKSRVVRVQSAPAFDKTAIITIEVPICESMNVRGLRLLKKGE